MTAQTAPSSKHPLDREFASVTELLAAASTPVGGCPAYNIRLAMEYASNGAHDARWYVPERPGITGNTGAQAFIRAANYPEGAARIAKLAAAIEAPEAVTVRRRPRWEDQGDEVDMQRVWAGNLDHAWRRTRRTAVLGPSRVRIAVPIYGYGGMSSMVLAWRGVCGVALADRLTEAGHSVEIVAYEASIPKDGAARVSVQTMVVKAYESPLDMGFLAAMIGCPAFSRGVLIPYFYAQSARAIEDGVAQGSPPLLRDVKTPHADSVWLVPTTVKNADTARAWIADVVAKMNARAAGEIPESARANFRDAA